MAYTDGLTELGNRAAFHEKENEIRCGRSDCYIIQLDINFLKKVNDEYGHAEGDRHIINASHIIRESFENIGESFRTGGDEFIVITKSCDEREVEKSVSKMEKSVLSYNKINPDLQEGHKRLKTTYLHDMICLKRVFFGNGKCHFR